MINTQTPARSLPPGQKAIYQQGLQAGQEQMKSAGYIKTRIRQKQPHKHKKQGQPPGTRKAV
ncbi:MAG: hypothetical protein R2874_11480 [Desulfobacterales bacterium]